MCFRKRKPVALFSCEFTLGGGALWVVKPLRCVGYYLHWGNTSAKRGKHIPSTYVIVFPAPMVWFHPRFTYEYDAYKNWELILCLHKCCEYISHRNRNFTGFQTRVQRIIAFIWSSLRWRRPWDPTAQHSGLPHWQKEALWHLKQTKKLPSNRDPLTGEAVDWTWIQHAIYSGSTAPPTKRRKLANNFLQFKI